MASSIDRVKQQIRERLDELESERDQLMKALEALSGPGAASVGGRRGRPPGSGVAKRAGGAGKRAAGKRAPRGQRREQVLDVLKGRALGPSAIAREIGDVNPTQISGLLRQLAAEGLVQRTPDGTWTAADGAPVAAATVSDTAPATNGAGQETPSPEDSAAGF